MTQKSANIPTNTANENINTSTESMKDNQNQRRLISEALGEYYKKNPQEVLGYLDGSSRDIAQFKKELLKESNLIKGQYTGGLENVPSSALEDFIKEEDIMIRREILSISVPRKNLERVVWKTCIDRYPLGSLSSHIHDIQNKIKSLDTTDLNTVLKNPKFGHKELIEPIYGNTITFRDATSIMNDLHLQNNEATQTILAQYTESGKIKSKDLVSLLKTQNTLTVGQKKIILSFFRPSFTINELITCGIYDAEKRKEIAETEVKAVLKEHGNHSGTDDIKIMIPDKEIQETVENWIKRTEDITIPTDQLSESEIEKILTQLSETSDLYNQTLQLLQEEEEKKEQAEREKRQIVHSFDEVKKKLEGKGIENLESMNQGSYIQLKDGTIGERYWRINSINNDNLEINIEMFDENGQLVNSNNYPYDRFVGAIDAHLKTSGATIAIFNERPAVLTAPYENMESFQNWIDNVDRAGKGMTFQNGMSFSVLIDGTEEIYHITKCVTSPIGRESFVLEDQYGNTYPKLSLEGFYDILSASYNHHEFKRLGDFSTLENFAKSSKIIGLIYKDGKLEMASEHTDHDEHSHDSHNKTVPVWGFQNDDGSYLKAEFKGNQVTVTAYSKFKDSDNKVDTKTGEKKRKESTKIKAEVYPPMTLDGFYSMLQKTKCTTPIEEDPRTKKDAEKHDSVHPHYHKQGIMGRLMGMKSLKDYGKMISMGTHMFEHMLEEQSRAHASEALYKTFSRTLGAEHAMTMHALMEFSGDISKLIEETVTNIKKLEAGQRRKEIRHILLTKPPKPHKILAALIATADMAGHLYPDADLQDLQGEKYLWFEAICEALGFSYQDEMKKAQEKGERFSKGNAGRLHETLLIERLFKQNHGKNPYIAAIGGGSKFWNAVVEGRNNQKSKGEKEVQQGLYGIDRAEYVVSKLESNEPEIAIGAYPGVYGKDPSAVNLGPAFVWALSNFPNTAHPETRNIFKNMMDANGVAFHALPFCKDETNAKIYKATLPILIEKLGHSNPKYSGMLSAWKKVQSYSNGSEAQTFQEDHIKELWLFWKNYHRLIHPILQLTDPYIFTAIADPQTPIEDASVLKSYVTTLGSTVKDGRLNDKGPEENIMKMGGYRFDGGSMIVDIDSNDGQKSIKRILNYLSPQSYTGVLGDITQVTYIWEGQILAYIKSIRENEHFINNPEYQKNQYIKIHDEVMTFLREKLTEGKYREISKQPYIRQLQEFGFDTSEENIFKSSNFGGEMAFERFKNGSQSSGVQQTQEHVQKDIALLTQKPANDENYDQQLAA